MHKISWWSFGAVKRGSWHVPLMTHHPNHWTIGHQFLIGSRFLIVALSTWYFCTHACTCSFYLCMYRRFSSSSSSFNRERSIFTGQISVSALHWILNVYISAHSQTLQTNLLLHKIYYKLYKSRIITATSCNL